MQSLKAFALLALLLLGGCLQPNPSPDSSCSNQTPEWIFHAFGDAETDTLGGWNGLVYWSNSGLNGLEIETKPNQVAEIERLDTQAAHAVFRIGLAPGAESIRWRPVEAAHCESNWSSWKGLAEPAEGRVAQAGNGAMVWLAAFSQAGELTWTNIPQMDGSVWPKGKSYVFNSSQPLPIFIYNQSPDEKPAWWGLGNGDFNASYGTLPAAVNQGFKGLSETTSRVVRISDPSSGLNKFGDPAFVWLKIEVVQEAPCPHWENTYLVCDLPA